MWGVKVAFHLNHLDMRGTGVAVFDYANHCETLLGHESVIVCPTVEAQPAFQSELATRRFESRFNIRRYDHFDEVDPILRDLSVDVLYAIKAGHRDHVVSNVCKTVVHAVFQNDDPHGDVYAYFSEWLSNKVSHGRHPWVPPMLDLPDVSGNLRDELEIPQDAIVFGRHGGIETFDIEFVHRAVFEVAQKRPDLYFLFMNTARFCDARPNIIHLPGSCEREQKVRFINTCDAMLHARHLGESFGLAVAEFSTRNRPVITHAGGTDQAHIEMLGDKGTYYRSEEDLAHLLIRFEPDPSRDWDVYSREFAPSVVMDRFSRVFLEDCQQPHAPVRPAHERSKESVWAAPVIRRLGPQNGPAPGLAENEPKPNSPMQMHSTHPIGFGIPAELFVNSPTATPKTRNSAVVTPYDRSTYRYPPTPEGESAYLEQYRESFFGVTCKKAGWDCMRHYEILSQGCMPWFEDISECPESCLVDFPKDLLRQVHSLPGCGFDAATGQVAVDPSRFDTDRYWLLLGQLWEYSRKQLTTKMRVRRMLKRAGALDCRNVLVLSVSHDYIDYLGGMVLHGLRSIAELCVTDHPRMDYMYLRPDRPDDHCEAEMWGFGFSLAHRLAEPNGIDRENLSARLAAGEFDLAIYVDAGKLTPERPLPLWDEVRRALGRRRVLLIDGNDVPSDMLAPYAPHGQLFRREQDDTRPGTLAQESLNYSL